MSAPLPPPLGTPAWFDLTVPDADRLRDFYASVVGWTPSPINMDGYSDYVMSNPQGDGVAGVCHARGPNAKLPPMWLIYVSVADLAKALAQVRELGGAVIDERNMGGNAFAVIRDPAGAHMALMQA